MCHWQPWGLPRTLGRHSCRGAPECSCLVRSWHRRRRAKRHSAGRPHGSCTLIVQPLEGHAAYVSDAPLAEWAMASEPTEFQPLRGPRASGSSSCWRASMTQGTCFGHQHGGSHCRHAAEGASSAREQPLPTAHGQSA
jgi:hypothetical protein